MIEEKFNFLEDLYHQELLNNFKSKEFPYYLIRSVTNKNSLDDYHLSHIFYSNGDGILSKYYDLLKPLFNAIDINVIVRAKLNLNFKNNEKRIHGGFHRDFEIGKNTGVPLPNLKNAILYLSTTNGELLIKDKNETKKILCEKNKLVTFSNNLEHTATTHTDKELRYCININYF